MIALVATLLVPVGHVAAQQAEQYGGGSVSGYAADQQIDNGRIVALDGEGSKKVKVAEQAQLQSMFGVTVSRTELPLTLSNEDLQNEVFVAVSGTYDVLVSTQGGPIEAGDYVTISSINGVAMRADEEVATVFGRANQPFDGTGVTLGQSTLKNVNGEETDTVSLGSIPVTIDIRKNPNILSTEANLPEFLQRLGQQIAEKEVNPIRIYLSMAITFISIITAIVILYAGVRNGVVSIGRNPMSKKSIFRALLEIILTAALVLIIGLFAVYLLLRL